MEQRQVWFSYFSLFAHFQFIVNEGLKVPQYSQVTDVCQEKDQSTWEK